MYVVVTDAEVAAFSCYNYNFGTQRHCYSNFVNAYTHIHKRELNL